MSNNTADFKSFHYAETGEITFSILNTIKTTTKLDSGCYRLEYLDEYPNPRIILRQDTNNEAISEYDFQHKTEIENLIDGFFNKKVMTKLEKLKIYHKMGLLLHGKEGTGKTSVLRYFIDKIIKEQNALVFYFINTSKPHKAWEFIENVRKIQNNPIVVVWDEFDRFVGSNADYSKQNEGLIKQIMDGQFSINNIIFFATTNYIELIPDTIKKRPSRFKYVFEMGGIDDVNTIINILTPMINDIHTTTEIVAFSEELKGNTVDEIKQICLGQDHEIESG
jgi:SpoVK/Ycf46/Vps4 family AAA+-type ATPase